jgi:hypothetical protein
MRENASKTACFNASLVAVKKSSNIFVRKRNFNLQRPIQLNFLKPQWNGTLCIALTKDYIIEGSSEKVNKIYN